MRKRSLCTGLTKKSLTKVILMILIEAMLTILVLLFLSNLISKRESFYELSKELIYLFGTASFLILSAVLFLLIKRQAKPEYIFAFLYLSLGILYMAAVPLYAVPDEANHFLRAYAITEGKLVADQNENGTGGSMFPANIVCNMKNGDMKFSDIADLAKISLSEENAFYLYGNTALYSPFTYTAQAVGIRMGKMVSSKAVVCAYCGRIVSWLTIGMILFFCIRYLPFGKYMLIAVSLLPMNMHESISLSGDGFTFAIVAAFLTFVLYARYLQKEVCSGRQYFLLYLLLFYLSSCKIVYVPFALAAFIIPRERFGSGKNYIRHVACAAFMTAAASAGWLAVSSGFLVEFNPGVDSARQVQIILSHPAQYLVTIGRTILDRGCGMVMTMLGSSLGYLNVAVSRILTGTAAGCLIYMTVRERQVWMWERALWQRFLLLASCGCCVFLIFTSLYVQWTPVGSGVIDGVQGRYFLPVLLPALLVLRGSKARKKEMRRPYKMQQLYQYADAAAYFVLLLTGILTASTCLTYFMI